MILHNDVRIFPRRRKQNPADLSRTRNSEAGPFAVLDQEGVGQLIKMATERGRKTRPELKVGICGEHGGEPSSVEFFHQVGLNYVSCSPFRVLTARLAAAQAAASEKLKVRGRKNQMKTAEDTEYAEGSRAENLGWCAVGSEY